MKVSTKWLSGTQKGAEERFFFLKAWIILLLFCKTAVKQWRRVLGLADLCATVVSFCSLFLRWRFCFHADVSLTSSYALWTLHSALTSGDNEIPVVYFFSKYEAFVIIDYEINMYERNFAYTVEGKLNLEHLKKIFPSGTSWSSWKLGSGSGLSSGKRQPVVGLERFIWVIWLLKSFIKRIENV